MTDRYVTPEAEERYKLFRLCECTTCEGTGKAVREDPGNCEGVIVKERCPDCRGEGRTRDHLASASDAESLGVAIVTLAREHELEGCPIGILDKPHQDKPGTWLVKPWQASARNVSDAARTLAKSKGKEKT